MKKEIIIIGGGTAGASAFAYFSYMYKNVANVKMIASNVISTVGVGEATVGHIKNFLRSIDIQPDKFILGECKGNIKYGVHLKDWYKEDWLYFTPVGTCGYDIYDHFNYDVSYKEMWESWLGLNLAFRNKSPFLKELDVKKLAIPSKINDYAFQFDAKLFAEKLIEKGKENGGEVITDDITELISEEEDKINYATSTSGKKYTADLWIDCSGFHKLIKKALHVEEEVFEDMNNNRAWATQIDYADRNTEFPYLSTVECQTMNAGWRWQIGLKERIGTGYVFSNEYISDDEALQEFKNSFQTKRVNKDKCHLIKFQTSCLKRQCGKNWLSVGLSSGFVEPLESTSIFLMHINIMAFATLHQFDNIPKDVQMLDIGMQRVEPKLFVDWNEWTDKKIKTFNNYTLQLFKNTVNYIGAHYAVNKNNKSKYWTDWAEKREKYLSIINQGLIRKDASFFLRPGWGLLVLGNQIPKHEVPNWVVGRRLELLPNESGTDEVKQSEINEILNNQSHEDFVKTERVYLGRLTHYNLICNKFSKHAYDLLDMYKMLDHDSDNGNEYDYLISSLY